MEGRAVVMEETAPRSDTLPWEAPYEVAGNSDRNFGLLSAEAQELQRSLRRKEITTSRPGATMNDENYWSRFNDRLSLQTLLGAHEPSGQTVAVQTVSVQAKAAIPTAGTG